MRWSVDEPFTVAVRDGRTLVEQLGPFATVSEAVDEMRELGQPGQRATIYNRGKVAQYRGARATFRYGRTQ